jgi:AcrR family transcriptional regulator
MNNCSGKQVGYLPIMQERSQKRRELILASAAELFARDGFDNVSTRHIAAKAGIPVGSIYQYYTNKLVILEGLRDKLLSKQQELLKLIDFEDYNGDLALFFADLVDALVVFSKDNHLLFLALNSSSSPEVQRIAGEVDAIILIRIEQRVEVFRPEIDGSTRHLLSRISMQLVQSVLRVGLQQPPKQRIMAINILKRLLVSIWEDGGN